jgi:hypothetical protein
LALFNDRLQGGVASKLETSSAEALVVTAAAALPELNQLLSTVQLYKAHRRRLERAK